MRIHVCERRLKKILECESDNKWTQMESQMEGALLRQFTHLYNCFCDANLYKEHREKIYKQIYKKNQKKTNNQGIFIELRSPSSRWNLLFWEVSRLSLFFWWQIEMLLQVPLGTCKSDKNTQWPHGNGINWHTVFWHTYAVTADICKWHYGVRSEAEWEHSLTSAVSCSSTIFVITSKIFNLFTPTS